MASSQSKFVEKEQPVKVHYSVPSVNYTKASGKVSLMVSTDWCECYMHGLVPLKKYYRRYPATLPCSRGPIILNIVVSLHLPILI